MSTEKARQTWARVANAYCVQSLCALICFFLLQETRSWDVENLGLLVFYRSKFGHTTLVVSDRFCKIQRSWRSEDRCTSVLCGSAFVMAVSATDSGKDLERYKKLVEEMT